MGVGARKVRPPVWRGSASAWQPDPARFDVEAEGDEADADAGGDDEVLEEVEDLWLLDASSAAPATRNRVIPGP